MYAQIPLKSRSFHRVSIFYAIIEYLSIVVIYLICSDENLEVGLLGYSFAAVQILDWLIIILDGGLTLKEKLKELFYLKELERWRESNYRQKQFFSYLPKWIFLSDIFVTNIDKLSTSQMTCIILVLVLIGFIITVMSFIIIDGEYRRIHDNANKISDSIVIYNLFIVIMTLLRCSFKSMIILALILASWQAIKFIYLQYFLPKILMLQNSDYAYYFIFGHLLNTTDSYDLLHPEHLYKTRQTLKHSLILTIIKMCIFSILSLVLSEIRPILQILFTEYLLLCMFFTLFNKTKTVIVLDKYFETQKDIIPFLQKYEHYSVVYIRKPDQLMKPFGDDDDGYQKLQNEQDNNQFELSSQEQIELLDYLRKQSLLQRIYIQQFNISVEYTNFMVNKVVDIQQLYSSLKLVDVIPASYLPPSKYLNLDIKLLLIDRALLLRQDKINTIPHELGYKTRSVYQQAQQQSFQIMAFTKNCSQYISINPTQVLYDLYE